MESVERKIEKYAVVINVNLIKASLKEATEFKNYFQEAIKKTDKDIIINLSICEHLDSAFLGILVRSYKMLQTKNRTIAIIEPVNQSSIFLTLHSISKIFPIYPSVEIALHDIENKKLLEKELDALSTEQSSLDDESELTFSEVAESIPQDETIHQHKDAESEEIDLEPSMIDHNSEYTFEPVEMTEEKTQASWTLIENEEVELKMDSYHASESGDNHLSSLKEEESGDRLEYEESPGENGIKWDFGFSS